MALEEIIEGVGQLEQWEHAETKHEVRYRFRITTEVIEKPGFPSVAGRQHSQGTVNSTRGETFPEGEYRLYAEDEILKVKNLGMGLWVILAS
jgi:hypothetical protein